MAPVGPAGLSSDSGLGGSTDGSTDILVFGSVVDRVTEEGENTSHFIHYYTLSVSKSTDTALNMYSSKSTYF